MSFSLYHLPTANLIGDFDDEGAALRAVIDEVDANDDAGDLALEVWDDFGHREIVAAGDELLQLATERVNPVATVTYTMGL